MSVERLLFPCSYRLNKPLKLEVLTDNATSEVALDSEVRILDFFYLPCNLPSNLSTVSEFYLKKEDRNERWGTAM